MSSRRSVSRETSTERSKEEERENLLKKTHPLDSVDPLDDEQQEQVIAELREAAAKQAARARQMFSILYKFIVCCYLFCFSYTYFYPWEIAHQSVFYGMVPLVVFQAYYVGMAIVYFIAGIAISKGIMRTNRHLNYMGAGISILFTIVMARYFWMFEVTEISLWWLPISPAAALGVAIWVDYDADRTVLEVENLNNLKYSHKKV